MSSRKRKRALRGSPDYSAGGEGSSSAQASASSPFFVQAHEATIIRGRPDLVKALTTRDHGGGKGGLIQWQGEGESERDVWVDRYDARLLLTSLPDATTRDNDAPVPSPTGWSDLPSDSEDTFFLTAEEIEDLRREKRHKALDAHREERLRALRDSEPDSAPNIENDRALWGGDNEEPNETQRILMERTAKNLVSSPNSAQLEMRILANHGADPRFAFLRGRWRNAWQSIKLTVTTDQANLERKASQAKANTNGGLVAYGDSDDEDGKEEGTQQEVQEVSNRNVVSDSEKEARRARAREWAQKRKESQGHLK